MNCQRVRELLPGYLDQDLERQDLAGVTQHLEACEACRLRLDLNRRLMVELAQLPNPPEAAEATDRLRRSVTAHAARHGSWSPLWRVAGTVGNVMGWVAASAVAALLVVALALTWRPMVEGRFGGRTPTPMLASARASPTATATPTEQARAVVPTAPPTPIASPTAPMVRHDYAELGFSAEVPADWSVMPRSPMFQSFHNGRPEFGVVFDGPAYAGGTYGYGIEVSVQDAAGQTLADAVEEWLAPVAPELQPSIVRRSLVVGGEPAVAMELQAAWGQAVMVVHDGRVYLVSFYKLRARHPEGDAVYESFLPSFTFIDTGQLGLPGPPPSITPAPTPTGWPTSAARTPTPPNPPQPMVTSLIVTPDEPPVLYAVIDSRLYRSTDRGTSWVGESLAGLPEGARLSRVAIDYRHAETMYALTDQGIYQREGQGEWGLVNSLVAGALAVDMESPNLLWAGIHRTTEYDAVIVKSEDGGRTWGKADYGIELGRAWTVDIAQDPRNPNTLWTVVRADAARGWQPGQVYRGGRDGHWERLSLGQFEPLYTNVDSCHVAGIAYDPNRNLLFAGCDLSYYNQGNLLLLRSHNADAADSSQVRWEAAAHFPPEPAEAAGVARPLAVDARDPRSLFLSTAVDLWAQPRRSQVLVSHDDGQTWERLELEQADDGAGLRWIAEKESR